MQQDGSLGVVWNSKASSEKLQRIAALETDMAGMRAALAACNATIKEMGENERRSALRIMSLETVIERAKDPADTDIHARTLASKGYVHERVEYIFDSCKHLNDELSKEVGDLKMNLGHTKASRGELKGLEISVNERIATLKARLEGGFRAVVEHVRESSSQYRRWARTVEERLERMTKEQQQQEEQEDSAVTVPSRHSRWNPTPSRSKPLYIMPPPDADEEEDWDADDAFARLQSRLASSINSSSSNNSRRMKA